MPYVSSIYEHMPCCRHLGFRDFVSTKLFAPAQGCASQVEPCEGCALQGEIELCPIWSKHKHYELMWLELCVREDNSVGDMSHSCRHRYSNCVLFPIMGSQRDFDCKNLITYADEIVFSHWCYIRPHYVCGIVGCSCISWCVWTPRLFTWPVVLATGLRVDDRLRNWMPFLFVWIQYHCSSIHIYHFTYMCAYICQYICICTVHFSFLFVFCVVFNSHWWHLKQISHHHQDYTVDPTLEARFLFCCLAKSAKYGRCHSVHMSWN